MNILGIETSCDETSAAVVRSGRVVLSDVIFSQVELHGPYGGVVPEIASRSHVEILPGTIDEAVEKSGIGWQGIDAVAVTYGPGLASSLLVGLAGAKSLSMHLEKPLICINHLHAHIYSVFLGDDSPDPAEIVPFLALVVSGGHTCLVRVKAIGQYALIGQTIDDAAGEAFDKGANLLGLGYPGGPLIDRISREANAKAVQFPRGRVRESSQLPEGLNHEFCFSFSGLKTSLLYYLKDNPLNGHEQQVADIAASYQEAIVDSLMSRCERALQGEQCLAVVGGVSLNSRLRSRAAELAEKHGLQLLLPAPRYCGDNAAMIAGLAGAGQGISGDAAMLMDADPNLPVV